MLENGAGVMPGAVMLGNGVGRVAISLLLASTEQSESDPVSRLLNQLEQLMPPRVWATLFVGCVVLLFLLNISDQLSGILGWLGVPSPFRRTQSSADQIEHTRQKLLKIVKKEVTLRLANSLHNLVKLDLYMEDQRQRVGNPKLELVPEDQPKDSEPSFQPVNRVLHPKGNKLPLNLKFTQKIIEVFDRPDIQGKLLILGEPGSGKTTELLQLAQDLVIRVEKDELHPVPVILELSSWDEEPIDTWVAKQLDKLYSLSEDTTQHWLGNNQILLLLDGLDELGLTKQRQCIEKINEFLETTRTSDIVVCCRREEYEAGRIALDGLNGAIYLEALKEDQVRQYFEELNRLSLWSNVSGNSTLLELTQKPLFLFMLVVAYQGNPIRNEQELFDAYVEKQLHDPNNQGTYKPGKEPSSQQTCYYLVWLAQKLDTISETDFLIERLQPTWLYSPRQKKLYRLSFGLSVCLSVWLISGLSSGLSFGLSGLLISLSEGLGEELNEGLLIVLANGLFLGLLGLILGLIIGLIVGPIAGLNEGLSTLTIEPKEKLQWSFRKMLDGLTSGLSGGLLLGLTFGLSSGLSNGLSSGLLLGLGSGLSSGLLLSLISGLRLGLSGISITDKETPNQGIRKSIQYALCIGLIYGLSSGLIGGLIGGLIDGLIGGLIDGLIDGLIFGLFLGLSIGMSIGMSIGLSSGLAIAIKHFILRIFLTRNGNTPWNYARFLDHAVKHRFIQRTGGRYRFVHDLLRKHFAAMPLD